MKRLIFALISIMTIISAQDKSIESPIIVKCVVSGDGIDLAEYSSYKKGKVYFCCSGCKDDFDDNSSKFTVNANFQLVSTKQYKQTSCPITGRDIKVNKFVIADGLKVTFCCNNCLGKATKSKNKVSLLFSDATFIKGFSPIGKKNESKK
jgi:YHS domain-containing protein